VLGNDVRERGRWTPLQTLKNQVIYAFVRLLLAVVRPAPRALLLATGRALGAAAYVLLRRERRLALQNLARAFPSADSRTRATLARRAFRQLGQQLGEAAYALRPGARVEPLAFAPGSFERLTEAVAEGRGVVLASAHLGPWERVAATFVAAGLPFATIAREAYDPRLTALYDRLRAPRGVVAIYRGRPGAGARMLRALRGGGVLGVPMDLRTRAASILVPFLGSPAPTPIGPARLALRTGAAVVVSTIARDAERGVVVSVTRIDTSDLRPDDAGVRALTERLNAELSRRIRDVPEGWVWMHDRFARPSHSERDEPGPERHPNEVH
jgi:KDO2-lipid IV(A) lauroyltransferase